MSQFTSALVVSPLADGKSWVILNDFDYHVGHENSADIVTVTEGFTTDFASVPRLFWFFIPRWGKYGNAAVVHDWLYWKQTGVSRKEADDILLEGMQVLKVGKLRMLAIYYAVRMFGWLAWFRNAAEKENGFDRVKDTSGIKAGMKSGRPGIVRSAFEYVKKAGQDKEN